ncbi:MAG: polyprenyl synthetase family protein [Dehalococcoidia bacterium]
MPKVKGLPAAQFTGTRPKLPDLFTRYSEQVQAEFCSILPNGSMELSDPFRYHLGWADESGERLTVPQGQGKALRSALCLFACQALDGDWMQAVPAATALELTHNFSLIHDDIQDGDTERRHRPTVWRLWGQPKALLVGDAMHAMAYQVALDLVERGVSESKALRSSRLLVESCLSMIKGQSLDLEFEDTLNIGLADYLEMIRLKTGALFTCSLEIGALLASDEAQHVQAFARYGNHLGRVFQIRDDVLGIWGNEEYTGKASGNDIRRRKKSFPIVLALEQARGTDRDQLVAVYQKESLVEADVDRVLEVLDTVGAQDHAHDLITKEASLALRELENAPLSAWARSEAESLVDFLVSREY